MVYDILIIGAGPAGSTLARLLGTKRSVLVLEGRSLEAGNFLCEKCCGGLLAPDAKRQLMKMGLAAPEEIFEEKQPLTVRAVDLLTGYSRRYGRAYGNIDRNAFEAWLLSLIPPNVALHSGERCVAIEKKGTVWEVITRGNGEGKKNLYKGKILVSAEGAVSLVRRYLSPKRLRHAMYVAVQDVYSRFGGSFASKEEYVAFFQPLCTDFYGWVIPKKDRVLLGSALPPRIFSPYNLSRRMDMVRSSLEQVGYKFDGFLRREGCIVLRPGVGDIFLGGDGAFCIGEAAGWISPSSAEGFSYAFASARAMAEAVLSGKNEASILRQYRIRTTPLMANIFWKQAKSTCIYTPPLRRLIMRSGLLSYNEQNL